jgi:hypothetical protein
MEEAAAATAGVGSGAAVIVGADSGAVVIGMVEAGSEESMGFTGEGSVMAVASTEAAILPMAIPATATAILVMAPVTTRRGFIMAGGLFVIAAVTGRSVIADIIAGAIKSNR